MTGPDVIAAAAGAASTAAIAAGVQVLRQRSAARREQLATFGEATARIRQAIDDAALHLMGATR